MNSEQLIRSMYEAATQHDAEKFASCFAEDGIFNDMPTGMVYRGQREIRSMAESWLKGFPDLKLQVKDIIGNDDLCSVELSVLGTHKGPFIGPQGNIPPSGKKVDAPSCDVIRVKDGKIQSVNCYFALPVMLNQLGAMPQSMAA